MTEIQLPPEQETANEDNLKSDLESKRSGKLLERGTAMYEKYKEYPANIVLSSIKEVYESKKTKLGIAFSTYIDSFGSGLVKLCQQKLVELNYDLGKTGTNGVDGIIGPKTRQALNTYYAGKKTESFESQKPAIPRQPSKPESVSSLISRPIPEVDKIIKNPVEIPPSRPQAKAKSISKEDATATDKNPLPKLGVVDLATLSPEQSPRKAEVTPKPAFEGKVKDLYEKLPSHFPTTRLSQYFGTRLDKIQAFLTDKDPTNGTPLTFLERPIPKLNLLAIPFLKIAEEKINASGIKYKPKAERLMGYENRDMNIQGQAPGTSGRKSSHAFGVSIDMDPTDNDSSTGHNKREGRNRMYAAINRGNIPDEVVLAMVESGFIWGGVKTAGFDELGDDPMHFQLRVDPRSAEGQAIINSSVEGRKYWNAIRPLLPSASV